MATPRSRLAGHAGGSVLSTPVFCLLHVPGPTAYQTVEGVDATTAILFSEATRSRRHDPVGVNTQGGTRFAALDSSFDGEKGLQKVGQDIGRGAAMLADRVEGRVHDTFWMSVPVSP